MCFEHTLSRNLRIDHDIRRERPTNILSQYLARTNPVLLKYHDANPPNRAICIKSIDFVLSVRFRKLRFSIPESPHLEASAGKRTHGLDNVQALLELPMRRSMKAYRSLL